MDHPTAMSYVESAGDLSTIFEDLIDGQWAFFEALGEGFAFNASHNEVVDPVLVSDVVKNADVRVIEAGDGFGFTLKALFANWIVRHIFWQNLDGDGTLKAQIAGAIHFAHSTCAKWRLNFVGPKVCAWNERHR